MGLKLVVVVVLVALLACSRGDMAKNSEVSTIYVPYQANSVYYPYPFARARRVRKVMVPVDVDISAGLHLDSKTKTEQAPLVNFVEGAYPVYYTPGHANGHFNGKISILH